MRRAWTKVVVYCFMALGAVLPYVIYIALELLTACAEIQRVAPLERVDPDCPCRQVFRR